MTRIALTVNSKLVEAETSPRTHLADFLRERLNLTGTHLGCEHGVCGACTVEMNGAIVRSCITYAIACDGAEIRTIESFDDDAVMVRLRSAFSSEHALQCGYCTPGMLITARDLVRRKQDLSEKQIRQEMSGNLCRCTGYVGIVNAIQGVMAEGITPADTTQLNGHLGPAPGPGAQGYTASTAHSEPAKDKPSKRPAPPVDTPQHTSPKIDVIVGKMSDRDGFTEIPQHFTLPHAREKVWALMSDLHAIADAMPGAELEDITDGNQITGRMSIKLGPMRPSFAGQATFERNDAEHSMEIEGSGRDKSSASSARGRIVYSLSEADGGAATRVNVAISYKLAGMLAQFGRGDIVRDVIQRLAAVFAQNIDARLSGTVSSANGMSSDGINAFALLWSILIARIAAIFGRGSGQA